MRMLDDATWQKVTQAFAEFDKFNRADLNLLDQSSLDWMARVHRQLQEASDAMKQASRSSVQADRLIEHSAECEPYLPMFDHRGPEF